MAVHERSWSPWAGAPTPGWKRLLILPRYAWREAFGSKIFTGLFAGGFLLPVVGAVVIYLRHNLEILKSLPFDLSMLFDINAAFFMTFLVMQSFLGFLLALGVGPALVSPDLVNGALPLYLSRPISRSGYVAGKFLVVALLLSAISWAPGLLLWGLQAGLEKNRWWLDNLRIAGGLLVGSLAFIVTVSLYTLAVSAFVRSRAVARAVLVGSVFVSSGMGAALRESTGSRWASLLMPIEVAESLWGGLLGVDRPLPLPATAAFLDLVAVCLLSLFLLHRKLRAFEVVR